MDIAREDVVSLCDKLAEMLRVQPEAVQFQGSAIVLDYLDARELLRLAQDGRAYRSHLWGG